MAITLVSISGMRARLVVKETVRFSGPVANAVEESKEQVKQGKHRGKNAPIPPHIAKPMPTEFSGGTTSTLRLEGWDQIYKGVSNRSALRTPFAQAARPTTKTSSSGSSIVMPIAA